MIEDTEREVRRIRKEYEPRWREIPSDFYGLHRPANLFMRQSQERALRDVLDRVQMLPLGARRILDVGCGLEGGSESLRTSARSKSTSPALNSTRHGWRSVRAAFLKPTFAMPMRPDFHGPTKDSPLYSRAQCSPPYLTMGSSVRLPVKWSVCCHCAVARSDTISVTITRGIPRFTGSVGRRFDAFSQVARCGFRG